MFHLQIRRLFTPDPIYIHNPFLAATARILTK